MLESLNKDFPEVLKYSVVQMYIKRCTEICWLMAVQDPPMALSTFEDEGNTFRRSKFREYTRTGALVDYAVWPAVLIQDDGDLMAKGVAQCCDLCSDNETLNKAGDESDPFPAPVHNKETEIDMEDNGDLMAKGVAQCYDNGFDNETLDKAGYESDQIPAPVDMTEILENEMTNKEYVALLHEVDVPFTKEVLELQNKVTETDVEEELTFTQQIKSTHLEETPSVKDKITMELEDEKINKENITSEDDDNETISNKVPTDSNTDNQTRTNHADE